jgi:glucan phosphoethanolaminetransferase (alkaline phosphatase superfamily)
VKYFLYKYSLLLLQGVIIVYILIAGDYFYAYYNASYNVPNFSASGKEILLLFIVGITLIKNSAMKTLLLAIVVISMLLQFLHYEYFGTYVQPISFYQSFMNTNEVFISFADEIKSMIVPFIISLGVFLLILKVAFLSNINKSKLGFTILFLIVSIGLINTYKDLGLKDGKLMHRSAKRLLPLPEIHSIENFSRSLKYFLVGILPKKILSVNKEVFPDSSILVTKDGEINANIILIIGETLRAKSMTLLGYKKHNTTPLLSNVNNLFYSSIYSAGTMTKTSISALLNRLKYPGMTKEIASQKNCLFNLAKKNGFNTHFYSAQKDSHLTILQSHICKKYIDQYKTRTSFHTTGDQYKYDSILNKMVESIDFNKGNNFVVLHQRGSHSPYQKQYPSQYSKFTNSYDNTVLYTDFVLSSIINYIEAESKKPTYIIFTSDHGELLGEHGKKGHGWFYNEVYKVPFLAKTFRLNGKQSNIFEENVNNIQSHYGVSNLLTWLLGFDVEVKKTNDIYVNGSDIDALAGYLHIKLDTEGNETSIIEVK